ncbi:V0D/AC39 family V-type ATPase subunit [Treponema pedis]|uniref:V0D/AC39 family V-type ATPase subunit n=1 Tax=Treponema pedis TaxID=409322 RepID=UPI000427C65F|nr:V-type ATPase subunit [Treponema pedis]
MDKSSASAYVYAKACGMYSKTFVGKKVKKLFEAKNIKELWSLIFTEEVPVVPEGQLADLIEQKLSKRLVADMLKLLSAYDKPDRLITALISKYDYSNLKTAWYGIEKKQNDTSFLVNISPYSVFHWEKWPNIREIIRGTCMEHIKVPEHNAPIEEILFWDSELDRMYYRSVWAGFKSLSKKDKESCKNLVLTEIIMQNIVWILRLRSYYGYKKEKILPLLAGIQTEETEQIFCKPAYFALERPLDDWNEWKDWEYARLLNPHEEGHPWILDPRWVQLECDKYLYKLAVKQFHSSAFTAGAAVAFFKIKRLEEYMIRAAAEILRVGADDEFKNEFIWG